MTPPARVLESDKDGSPMGHVQAYLKRRRNERGYASAATGEKSAKGGNTTFSKVQT